MDWNRDQQQDVIQFQSGIRSYVQTWDLSVGNYCCCDEYKQRTGLIMPIDRNAHHQIWSESKKFWMVFWLISKVFQCIRTCFESQRTPKWCTQSSQLKTVVHKKSHSDLIRSQHGHAMAFVLTCAQFYDRQLVEIFDYGNLNKNSFSKGFHSSNDQKLTFKRLLLFRATADIFVDFAANCNH